MGSGKIAKAEVNDLPHLNLDPIGLPRQVNRQLLQLIGAEDLAPLILE
jgi:hypothetical protein